MLLFEDFICNSIFEGLVVKSFCMLFTLNFCTTEDFWYKNVKKSKCNPYV